jgi:adenylate cyclase class 2
MTDSLLEIEAKFNVPTVEPYRAHLLALGATLSQKRVFERNLLLDTPDQQLRQAEQVLRLRQDNAVRLTFKSKPIDHSEMKVREEIEMEVGDLETAVILFDRLGYKPQLVYEKYRETYHLGTAEIVLDELPYGDFVEIEGNTAEIKRVAAAMGLDINGRLSHNYLELMFKLKQHHNLPFNDLTFANFADLDIAITDILGE